MESLLYCLPCCISFDKTKITLCELVLDEDEEVEGDNGDGGYGMAAAA